MKRVLFIIAAALGLVSYMLTVPATARGQTATAHTSFVAITPGLPSIEHTAAAMVATLESFGSTVYNNGATTNANNYANEGAAAQRKTDGQVLILFPLRE